MRKIRIAQIGMNMYSHGMQIFQRLERQSDAFELVGYCLPEKKEEK